MSDLNGNGTSGRGDKRHMLDELFADQPYLSATMKARLLHERLEQFGDSPRRDADAAPPLPVSEVTPEGPDSIAFSQAPVFLAAQPATLRTWAQEGRLSRSCAARLLRFRDGHLAEWRRALL